MASGAGIRLPAGASHRMNSVLGEWRESKVRPIPGNAPHDRPVSRGMISPRSIGDDAFRTTRFPPHSGILPGPSVGVFKAWRNLSGPMGYQNQTLARDPTASRRSAPSQGQRTRREDRAPSHRPQMSSGRLFLDRVGRHQSPSPRHRHAQTTTHFPSGLSKPERSTLLGSGTFYFAATQGATMLHSRWEL